MWRWVAAMKAKNPRRFISTLKKQWLRENKIKIAGDTDCFFCEEIINASGCRKCPGKLVDFYFSCIALEHHYIQKPAAFYRELLRLNRIRKGKK